MKKYVYSKLDERVTVETDGLGTINNFMITGLIGDNYGNMVHAGFNFGMGQSVTIAEMLNMAKAIEARVDCYEGNKFIVDESADFTSGAPVLARVVIEGYLRRENFQGLYACRLSRAIPVG
jgi:hypothetical protein